jgi:hypothetical protein
MARTKQTGQSPEYYLLYDILKQLERLTQVVASTTTNTTTVAP